MKKKILALFLVLAMMVTFAVPAFAADAKVQALYDSYTALSTALQGGNDIDAVKTTDEAFLNLYNDAFENFNDTQFSELFTLMGCSREEAVGQFLTTHIIANYIIETEKVYDAYNSNKNAKTAFDLVEWYNSINNDPDFSTVRTFFADIDTVYSEALTKLPAQEVLDIYNAYTSLVDAINSNTVSEVQTAFDKFSEIMNDENFELNDQMAADLFALMGCTEEEYFSNIISVIINGGVILETANVYDAFLADKNKETAQELVDMYDSIFNDPEYVDEELRELVRNFFADIDDVYEEAEALLATKESKKTTAKKTTTTLSDNSIKSPKTGDNTITLWLALMLISGSVVITMTVYNRKKKYININ